MTGQVLQIKRRPAALFQCPAGQLLVGRTVQCRLRRLSRHLHPVGAVGHGKGCRLSGGHRQHHIRRQTPHLVAGHGGQPPQHLGGGRSVLPGAGAEHRKVPLPGVVAVGKAAPAEYRPQRFQIRHLPRQRLPAGGHGGRHIFGTLQPPLYLKARHPQRLQLPQPVGQRQVLQGKGVFPPVARKIQTAGLGAAPAVAAAFPQQAA